MLAYAYYETNIQLNYNRSIHMNGWIEDRHIYIYIAWGHPDVWVRLIFIIGRNKETNRERERDIDR